MIDISAVKAESCVKDVDAIVEAARKYHFICVFTLPSLAPYARQRLAGAGEILLGGAVGFPSGGPTIATKAFEASELLALGCDELDMVINIGKLKSGLYQEVADEISQVVRLAGTVPLKVILEVNLLTDAEIRDGARIVRDCGARYVKTGTGWLGATSFDHIRTIQEAVGDSIKIKVAGGVRDLDVLLKMHAMGVSRFGIGHLSAVHIMEEFIRMEKG